MDYKELLRGSLALRRPANVKPKTKIYPCVKIPSPQPRGEAEAIPLWGKIYLLLVGASHRCMWGAMHGVQMLPIRF